MFANKSPEVNQNINWTTAKTLSLVFNLFLRKKKITCNISLFWSVWLAELFSVSILSYTSQHPIGVSVAKTDWERHSTEMLNSPWNCSEVQDCEQQQHRAVGKAYAFKQASQNSNKPKEIQSHQSRGGKQNRMTICLWIWIKYWGCLRLPHMVGNIQQSKCHWTYTSRGDTATRFPFHSNIYSFGKSYIEFTYRILSSYKCCKKCNIPNALSQSQRT